MSRFASAPWPLKAAYAGLLASVATAALAMGEGGISWLAKRAAAGYDSAVVTDDGRAFSSTNLPAAV